MRRAASGSGALTDHLALVLDSQNLVLDSQNQLIQQTKAQSAESFTCTLKLEIQNT